jgi:hypothetical protein
MMPKGREESATSFKTLKGFRGVRSGPGRDSIELEFLPRGRR